MHRTTALFGATMLIIVGAFNVLDGLVALLDPDRFNHDVLVATVEFWGWVFTVYGVVQAAIGFAVLRGSTIALWLGIPVAGVNAMAQIISFAQYPAWSAIIILADLLVIYGFAVRGMALGVEETAPDTSHYQDRDRVAT